MVHCTSVFVFLVGFTFVDADVSYVDLTQFENFTVPDLNFVCQNYQTTDISEKCSEQLDIVCQNSTLLFTMVDASSKFPYTGVAYSTRMDLGNFDQCMTVDHKYEGGIILGEFCTTGLVIPDFFGNVSDVNSMFKLAVCRPNGCSASDLNTILSHLTDVDIPLFQDLMCQTVESGSEFTALDIITIFIICTCVLLIVISTTYEFLLIKKQLECPNQLYVAFSVISNGKKLCHVTKQSREQIEVFQGMRVISMAWVIAGHSMIIWAYIPINNTPDVVNWQQSMYAAYITVAPFAVDTFFFISGFLLAYQYLKEKPKPFVAHINSVPSTILHRYLRLTPALFILYLVVISLLKHLGSGPLWSVMFERNAKTCKTNWWSVFLYIQNYYNYDTTEMCMAHTWYLSADMQLFIIALLVMIPVALLLQKSSGFKVSIALMIILNIFLLVLPLAIKFVFKDYDNSYDTHSRLIDYFVGITLGIFMRVKQDKKFLYMIDNKNVSIINLVTWVIVLTGMLVTLLCHRIVALYEDTYTSQVVFSSLSRPIWCAGLSWIAYSCYHGYGGIVNWILTRDIFHVWGRLTYTMYLLHLVVIESSTGLIGTRLAFSDYNAFYTFCGHFVVTLFLAVAWTLAFESPLITIEKVIFGRKNSSSKDKRMQNPSVEDGIEENPIKREEI